MPASKSAKPPRGDAVVFETQLAELEALVERLEHGDIPLAEAVSAYERGLKTAQSCEKLLQDAERRLEELTQSQSADESEPDQRTENPEPSA